jgi:hypothetical protein
MTLERVERSLRRFLIDVTGQGRDHVTTYSEIAEAIRPYSPVRLEPPYSPLHHWLGHVSRFEVDQDRPMLSAVVVRADTGRPGGGFYTFARQLGLDFVNEEQFWREQLEELHRLWSAGVNTLVETHIVHLADGRTVRIREYLGGSIRVLLDDAPYVITEAFITRGRTDRSLLRLEPVDWLSRLRASGNPQDAALRPDDD